MYNGIGNIVSVNTYGYTPVGTELSGTPRKTEAFTYGDTANPDRLTSFNGADITYNANGGVATYNGYDYSWSKGKLSTIRKVLENSSRALILPTLQSSITYTFGYNGLGQRISINYNYINVGDLSVQLGELTAYSKKFSYDHSGRLIHETNSRTYYQEGGDSYEIVYLYDDSGVVGMVYTENNTTSAYYFQRNLMGDVVAIYDTNGAKIVGYNYDAWGNCKIASSTTNYTIANANPFRYRGYYFDTDTGLYYLNARYYSPEFRRFISPDDTAYLNPKNVNGCNLYCYCNNDPVNFVDPSGHELVALQIIGFLLYMAVLAALIVLEIVLITSVIIEAIQNAQKQKPPQFLPEDVDEENITLPYKPEDTQIIFEGLIKGATTINKTVFPIKDINKNNNFNNNYSGNSWSGSYNSKVNYVSNNSGPKGPFGGAARGDSLWDPVLLAILNESFTGVFE